MRVEIAPDVFTDDPDRPYDPNDLYALLRCFPNHRHEWITDQAVVEAVAQFLPRHLPLLADTYLHLAEDAMVTAAWTGTSQRTEPVRVTRADLPDHTADLCQPAVLVVENHESDGAFLRAVAHALADDRVTQALDEQWLEVYNGGGSGLVKAAREAITRFRRVVRVVALLDSDRMIPQQRTGNHDKADKLTKLDVAVHVLARREAENYVPYKVLALIGRRGPASRRVDHYRRLTPEQRAHFDVKHGFGKAGPAPAVLPAQRDLFQPLDWAVRHGLHEGFGQDVLRHLYEHRAELTEQDFAGLGDDVLDELRQLLSTIASRI